MQMQQMLQLQQQYPVAASQQQWQPQQQQIMHGAQQQQQQIVVSSSQYQQRQLQPQQQQIMPVSNQINGVHELQYQQLYYRQQQQQLLMDGNAYPASQIGTQLQFFTNQQQQIDQKQVKSQILFICLEARQWQGIVCDQYDGSFMYVRPGVNPISPDLEEGIDVVHSKFIYGGDNSRTISECYNGLFIFHVLGTELGRRYLRHSYSSSIGTDLKHDEQMLQQRTNHSAVLQELKQLIAEQEKNEHNKTDEPQQEGERRYELDAMQEMEKAESALEQSKQDLLDQQQLHEQQLTNLSDLERQKHQLDKPVHEIFTRLSEEMLSEETMANYYIDQAADDALSHLMSSLSVGGEDALKVISVMFSKATKCQRTHVSGSINDVQSKKRDVLVEKAKVEEECVRLTAEAEAKKERYKSIVEAKEKCGKVVQAIKATQDRLAAEAKAKAERERLARQLVHQRQGSSKRRKTSLIAKASASYWKEQQQQPKPTIIQQQVPQNEKTRQQQASELLSGINPSNAKQIRQKINELFSKKSDGTRCCDDVHRSQWKSFESRHKDDAQYHLLGTSQHKPRVAIGICDIEQEKQRHLKRMIARATNENTQQTGGRSYGAAYVNPHQQPALHPAIETDTISCGKEDIGHIIGNQVSTINDLQHRSSTNIQISRSSTNIQIDQQNYQVSITGPRQGIELAKAMKEQQQQPKPTIQQQVPQNEKTRQMLQQLPPSLRLPTYLHDLHTNLAKYNYNENTTIAAKIDSFKNSIHNSISALELSTGDLESFVKLVQLDGMDNPRSAQLLNKINTDDELKTEMYNNVERYGLSPFLDNSKSTKEIQKILVSGIVKGDSASSITKAIRDGNEKHNWAAPKFSSRPILDNPSTHSDPLAPIVATLARGSRDTKNCLTSQITKCFTTPHFLARIGVLPPNTQILLQAFGAYNIDRDEVYTARAISSFISFLLKTNRDRLVYLSVNEILRLGLPPEHIVPLVLVFINIHPNIKLLSAGELCMPFLDVVSRNFVRSLSEKLINDIFGGPRHPGLGLVGMPISEQKYTLDSKIIINGTTTTIKTYALSLLHDWRGSYRGSGIESLPIPSQIKEGISRGSSHPKAKTISIKVKELVDKLTTNYFKDNYSTLEQQVVNVDEVIDNEIIAAELPISIGKKKYVIIYLRDSKKDSKLDTIFELAASQFTICYASCTGIEVLVKWA